MGRPPLKKKSIERSALELFVEKGVDGTSIRDIASRAGVTEGALYRHHEGKDELIRALFIDHFQRFAELIAATQGAHKSFAETITKLVEVFFTLHDEDPPVFEFIMVARHRVLDEVRADEKNLVELVYRLVKDAIKNGEIPEQNPDLLTELMIGMVLQTTVGVRYQRLKLPLAKHAKAVARACLAAAGAKLPRN
ncbi:TetR/AcrR family transcriptional regulator [Candidatus Sumerlaeota bacterium]|nr:TetR/AcrR family transcriptional regulator [Candidatus Sumerlaeota bacterium]